MFEALMSVGGLVLWLAFWWLDLRHGTPAQQEAEMWHKAAAGVRGHEEMTCGYEAPHWAHYPDARCIDGWLWDLDSGDGDYLTSGGDVPCPCCNTVEYLDYLDKRPSGNARQRRRWLRVEAAQVPGLGRCPFVLPLWREGR